MQVLASSDGRLIMISSPLTLKVAIVITNQVQCEYHVDCVVLIQLTN